MAEETPQQLQTRLAAEREEKWQIEEISKGSDGSPLTIEEQRAHKDLLARMARSPEEVKASYDPTSEPDGTETYPISVAEMRGDPSKLTLGTLTLILRPLKRREIREKFSPLLRRWPEILQYGAAVKNPRHPGIDKEAVAFLISLFQASEHVREEEGRRVRARKENAEFIPTKAPDPVSVEDVEQFISALVSDTDSFMPTICDTVWLMAEGVNPGLAWPRPPLPEIDGDEDEEKTFDPAPPEGCQWLDYYLDDNLYTWQLVDLLRSLLLLNGSFPGSLISNFEPL